MITADDQVRARGCRANETDRAPFWISKLFPEADSKRRRRMIDLTLRSDPFPSPIQPPQGKFKSIALIRATDENAAPQNGGEGESPTRVGPQPGPNTSPPPRVTFHPSHADNNVSPFYPTGGAKPAAIGLKRSVGARADPAKKARVLRFVIR